jgi:hypothetical protein
MGDRASAGFRWAEGGHDLTKPRAIYSALKDAEADGIICMINGTVRLI